MDNASLGKMGKLSDVFSDSKKNQGTHDIIIEGSRTVEIIESFNL